MTPAVDAVVPSRHTEQHESLTRSARGGIHSVLDAGNGNASAYLPIFLSPSVS